MKSDRDGDTLELDIAELRLLLRRDPEWEESALARVTSVVEDVSPVDEAPDPGVGGRAKEGGGRGEGWTPLDLRTLLLRELLPEAKLLILLRPVELVEIRFELKNDVPLVILSFCCDGGEFGVSSG